MQFHFKPKKAILSFLPGENSIRKPHFQGPLTLGLASLALLRNPSTTAQKAPPTHRGSANNKLFKYRVFSESIN